MKILKRILIVILVLLIGGEIYLFASGKTYVNFLLKHTILKGRMGPDIDEFGIYANREVEATNPKPWPMHTAYNQIEMTPEMEKWHEDYGTVGFGVFVGGEILFEEYWEDYGKTSKSNSWSMAKSIVSHLVGVLVTEGKISDVNDKFSKYLPHYNTGDVTIKHLLTMSSGMSFDEDYLNPFSYPARSLYDKNLEGITAKYRSEKTPGEVFDYQSGNTQLLAFLVDELCDTTISAYASMKLWGPIGAEETALWSLDQENGTEKAFCCFNSNVRDFARFGELYRNGCIIDSVPLVDRQYVYNATHSADLKMKSGEQCKIYGYQWWIIDHLEHRIFYARGLNGQYIFVIPELDCVIVRLGHDWDGEKINDHPIDVYEYVKQGIYLLETQRG